MLNIIFMSTLYLPFISYILLPHWNRTGRIFDAYCHKNMPENRFAFRDHATDKYVSYLLTDTCAIMEEEFYLPSLDNKFFGK